MLEEGKKQYEIAFLARTEDGKNIVSKEIAKIGAEVTLEGRFAETRLQYPIKKQTVAYFGFYDFIAETGTIAALDQVLKFDESILRFLIVTPPPRKPVKARIDARDISSDNNQEIPVEEKAEATDKA